MSKKRLIEGMVVEFDGLEGVYVFSHMVAADRFYVVLPYDGIKTFFKVPAKHSWSKVKGREYKTDVALPYDLESAMTRRLRSTDGTDILDSPTYTVMYMHYLDKVEAAPEYRTCKYLRSFRERVCRQYDMIPELSKIQQYYTNRVISNLLKEMSEERKTFEKFAKRPNFDTFESIVKKSFPKLTTDQLRYCHNLMLTSTAGREARKTIDEYLETIGMKRTKDRVRKIAVKEDRQQELFPPVKPVPQVAYKALKERVEGLSDLVRDKEKRQDTHDVKLRQQEVWIRQIAEAIGVELGG